MGVPGVVLVLVDRLRPDFIGAYGNARALTPFFDEFAARSLLFDSYFGLNDVAHDNYYSLMAGVHPARIACDEGERSVDDLRTFGTIAFHQIHNFEAKNLDGIVAAEAIVHVASLDQQAAETIETTHSYRTFDAAARWLENDLPQMATRPWLLVVHDDSMDRHWDAPFAWREESFLEAGLTDLDVDALPVHRRGSKQFDAERVLMNRALYEAQIRVVEESIALLFDVFDASNCCQESVFVITSLRGIALSRPDQRPLANSVLQLPLLVHDRSGSCEAHRDGKVVSPVNVHTLLRQFLELPEPPNLRALPAVVEAYGEQASPARNRLYQIDHRAGWYGVRDQDWMMRWPVGSSVELSEDIPNELELYSKPDDRWEANDVRARCPDVVEELWHDVQRNAPWRVKRE